MLCPKTTQSQKYFGRASTFASASVSVRPGDFNILLTPGGTNRYVKMIVRVCKLAYPASLGHEVFCLIMFGTHALSRKPVSH